MKLGEKERLKNYSSTLESTSELSSSMIAPRQVLTSLLVSTKGQIVIQAFAESTRLIQVLSIGNFHNHRVSIYQT